MGTVYHIPLEIMTRHHPLPDPREQRVKPPVLDDATCVCGQPVADHYVGYEHMGCAWVAERLHAAKRDTRRQRVGLIRDLLALVNWMDEYDMDLSLPLTEQNATYYQRIADEVTALARSATVHCAVEAAGRVAASEWEAITAALRQPEATPRERERIIVRAVTRWIDVYRHLLRTDLRGTDHPAYARMLETQRDEEGE